MSWDAVTLEKVAKMDRGRLGLAFQDSLRDMVRDCKDRPSVKAARQIRITVTLKPDDNERGLLDGIAFQARIDDKRPTRQTREYAMKLSTDGDLMFNDEAPENPSQRTMDEIYEQEDVASD